MRAHAIAGRTVFLGMLIMGIDYGCRAMGAEGKPGKTARNPNVENQMPKEIRMPKVKCRKSNAGRSPKVES